MLDIEIIEVFYLEWTQIANGRQRGASLLLACSLERPVSCLSPVDSATACDHGKQGLAAVGAGAASPTGRATTDATCEAAEGCNVATGIRSIGMLGAAIGAGNATGPNQLCWKLASAIGLVHPYGMFIGD